jgi:putative sigma-54 modulation protein
MFNQNLKIMKVNVHAVNFNVDKKLVDFVEERMSKLEKFYDKVVSYDVFLKVEKTSDKENKIVEAKIIVPGDEFIVKKQCKTFEEGVELASESLERLLVKRKEKIRAHI